MCLATFLSSEIAAMRRYCIDTRFSGSENEAKKHNRQKALAEKRRRVQLFGETIDSITERYNLIVEAVNAHSDYKFLDGIETILFKR